MSPSFLSHILDFCHTHPYRAVPKAEPAAPDVVHMQEALKPLADGLRHGSSAQKKAFHAEVQSFLRLFSAYVAQKAERRMIDWDRIESPAASQIIDYAQLPKTDRKYLNKLAVLKVNGGLGTSMGLAGAKAALEVKDGLTFLDIIVRQMDLLNTENHADVPLVLMTSFHTHADTVRVIQKYASSRLRITTFQQSRFPRVYKDTLEPCPKTIDDEHDKWYPPGHGDLYESLVHSGLLDQLLSQGKEYLFVSNADNLGATVDEKILQHMVESKADFIMEVTNKTRADIQGGTLVNYDGHIRLLEMAQVPPDHVEDFQSARRFKIFNTNNLWLNLKSLKRIMTHGGMDLDLIVKECPSPDGHTLIELETAAGAAMKHFGSAHGLAVPRSRFLPVKTCSDLLLLASDLYALQHGRLVLSPERVFGAAPVVKLGDHYRKISDFKERFKQVPKMMELDHLTVTGDVYFGRNVTLKGTVILAASEGQRMDIPDGCTLENRLMSGDLKLIEL